LDQFVDVCELIDAPAQFYHTLDPIRRQREHCLIAEFIIKLLISHRPMDIAQRFFHKPIDLLTRN
jgi:hypothetical protein